LDANTCITALNRKPYPSITVTRAFNTVQAGKLGQTQMMFDRFNPKKSHLQPRESLWVTDTMPSCEPEKPF
jgi:hypothetical protein